MVGKSEPTVSDTERDEKVPTLSIKKRCNKCRMKRPLLSRCKYCDMDFCFSCLQFEVHSCRGYEKMRDEKKTVLNKRLVNERCEATKVISI